MARALTEFHIYIANSCTRTSASYDRIASTSTGRSDSYSRKHRKSTAGRILKESHIYVYDWAAMTSETVPWEAEKTAGDPDGEKLERDRYVTRPDAIKM